MRAALAMLLIVGGLMALATPWLPAGLVCIGVGGWLFHKRGAREDRFVAVLMLLGGLGALVAFVSFVVGGDFSLPTGG